MHYSYLLRGVYVDQLEAWFNLYPKEQILILKSEDFFATPYLSFNQALKFLNLPAWEPKEYKLYNAREKSTNPMQVSTRERLVEYFRPYNQRLYQLLGVNMNWDQ